MTDTAVATLRQALWEGPVTGLDERAQALLNAVAPGNYEAYLATARAVIQMGARVDLSPALARFAWSIDLAALDVEQAVTPAQTDAALDRLARTVCSGNRRRAVYAWAAWARGRKDAALRIFDPAMSTSETLQTDAMAQAELLILADMPTAIPYGGAAMRLRLLQLWRRDGALALAKAVDQMLTSLPPDAGLWTWLTDTFITERDFARARRIAEQARTLLGAPVMAPLDIRLALEAGDIDAAEHLLAPLCEGPPVHWSAQTHVLSLRTALMRHAVDPTACAPFAQAQAALRLFPRHGMIAWLWTQAALRCMDWTELEATTAPDDWCRLLILQSLGLPERALAHLDSMPPGGADTALRHALRRTECLMAMGQPQASLAALGARPEGWPQQADQTYWLAEILLRQRQIDDARQVVEAALARGETRMGLHLHHVRIGFFQGDAGAAAQALSRFNALKADQLGAPPEPDLRDQLVADLQAHPTDTAHPAAAARALLTPPAFVPAEGEIPRRLWHYWQGPLPHAAQRGARAWQAQHPGWSQTVLNADTGRDWLAEHAPHLVPLFDRHTGPATRADLIRVALMTVHGGLFADLDELPRAPVLPWLKDARSVLVIEEGFGTVANNFLATTPRQTLFDLALTQIAARLEQVEQAYPWWDCGPAMMTVATQACRAQPGLRLLSQSEYNSRVSTNLPFPHKAGPDHWRAQRAATR